MAEPLGVTYDSGALIALARDDRRAWRWHEAARRMRRVPTVPAVCIAETVRDPARQARLSTVLAGCVIEPLTGAVARRAGVALGRCGIASTVDACVMASAARRGDMVLTSDPDDLARLASEFPSVVVVPL